MNALNDRSRSTPRMLVQALPWLVLLGACATPAPQSSEPVPSAPVAGVPVPVPAPATAPGRPSPLAPVVTPLVSEQRWLDEWFRGTPVTITLADANTLAVDVPLANSFEARSSAIKPALAAVLDRVATSLRRQPPMRVSIAAPSDAGGTTALASARAQQVRDHLVSRGVAATRITGVGSARAGAPVQLRLLTVPQEIGRLNDAALPIPASGVKPTSAAPASAAKR